MTTADLLRADYALISELVPQKARVLDLGCGDGALLALIRKERDAFVRGVELSPDNVAGAIARGLSVFQGDLDEGLADFRDGSFDVVILSHTLQVVRYPRLVLEEMLRVADRAIVSFPNFGYWRNRASLFFTGRMPVSQSLPYQWYDTPNIHLCTVADFDAFLAARNYDIIERVVLARDRPIGFAPNARGELAIYRFRRG
jgi:methionine biosynthesis protein MetW